MFDYVEEREIVTKTISHIVKLNDVEFDLELLFDIMGAVRGRDVFFNPVLLHISDEQIKALDDAEIIVTSVRGGVGEGSKLEELLNELEEIYDEHIDI